jgi:hypothetical protein
MKKDQRQKRNLGAKKMQNKELMSEEEMLKQNDDIFDANIGAKKIDDVPEEQLID